MIRAYTIHLQKMGRNKMSIRRYHTAAESITKAIEKSQTRYLGWEVCMAWYDWPNSQKAINSTQSKLRRE